MNELKCLHCEKPLTKTGKKSPKYCNARCRYAYLKGVEAWEPKELLCVVCFNLFLPRDRRQVCCSDECSRKRKNGGASSYEYTCQKCGKVYQAKAKNRDKYCSRACAFSDIKAWRRDASPAETFNCVACGTEFKRVNGFGNHRYCSTKCRDAEMERQCVICQQPFVAISPDGRFCSDECRAENARRNLRRVAADEHRKIAKICQCTVCGVLFSPLYGTKKRAFCSDKCKKERLCRDKRGRGGNNTQRAKRLGLPRKYFNERKILERDGWTCYLCGQPTPPELRGTYEPNAPELDHIVPLSKGGPHIKANVACICRRCNGKKGNRTLGEMGLMERVCVTQTRMQF